MTHLGRRRRTTQPSFDRSNHSCHTRLLLPGLILVLFERGRGWTAVVEVVHFISIDLRWECRVRFGRFLSLVLAGHEVAEHTGMSGAGLRGSRRSRCRCRRRGFRSRRRFPPLGALALGGFITPERIHQRFFRTLDLVLVNILGNRARFGLSIRLGRRRDRSSRLLRRTRSHRGSIRSNRHRRRNRWRAADSSFFIDRYGRGRNMRINSRTLCRDFRG